MRGGKIRRKAEVEVSLLARPLTFLPISRWPFSNRETLTGNLSKMSSNCQKKTKSRIFSQGSRYSETTTLVVRKEVFMNQFSQKKYKTVNLQK